MNLSNWLAVIGIIMGTLMSLISIEVARRRSDTNLLRRLIELVHEIIEKLNRLIPRQPKPRETPKLPPTLSPPPRESRPPTEPKNEDQHKTHRQSRNFDQESPSTIELGHANLAGSHTPPRTRERSVFIHPSLNSLSRHANHSRGRQ
jgi:hypothetical protein